MITKETPIEEIAEIHAAAEVLMMHGLICGGCDGCGANFGTIEDVAKVHGLDADGIVSELNQAIDEAEED